jgi:hypothetical protein
MTVFIVLVAVIGIIVFVVNKNKNAQQKEKLINGVYKDWVIPLRNALEKEGYKVDSMDLEKCDSRAGFCYAGTMRVYKADECEVLGLINFATYSDAVALAYTRDIFKLQSAELEALYRTYEKEMKTGDESGARLTASFMKAKMVVELRGTNVLLSSAVKTAIIPPDIPEWLTIGAKNLAQWLRDEGVDPADPDWVNEAPLCKKYVNVMFR